MKANRINALESTPMSIRMDKFSQSLGEVEIIPPSGTNCGGQHASSVGISTTDLTDEQDNLARLDDFNSAWEQIRYGCVSGREW